MSRIRVVLSALEIEYEGEQSFIEESLLRLAEDLLELNDRLSSRQVPAADLPARTSLAASRDSLDVTTNTIAQMITAKTGSDLALAAIARINIVKGHSTAPRPEILDEMKQASTYYKDTYGGNLSAYLDTLVKSKKINLVARATYALAAAERGRLEPLIANGL